MFKCCYWFEYVFLQIHINNLINIIGFGNVLKLTSCGFTYLTTELINKQNIKVKSHSKVFIYKPLIIPVQT